MTVKSAPADPCRLIQSHTGNSHRISKRLKSTGRPRFMTGASSLMFLGTLPHGQQFGKPALGRGWGAGDTGLRQDPQCHLLFELSPAVLPKLIPPQGPPYFLSTPRRLPWPSLLSVTLAFLAITTDRLTMRMKEPSKPGVHVAVAHVLYMDCFCETPCW